MVNGAVVTFKSVDQTIQCDHSLESSTCGAVCQFCDTQGSVILNF